MSFMPRALTALAAALTLVGGALVLPGAGAAQDKIRVGKAVPEAFTFAPLDIGIRQGFFKKRNLDIESIAFAGDAKMQQAAAAGGIELMLGSGPGLGFIAKGSPVKGVAAMAGPPLLLVIVVRPDGPKTVAELKGKRIGVSTPGSLTYYLVAETSARQGWGPNGIDIKPMGAMAGQLAAMKRGDLDGSIMDVGNAYHLERAGEGRIVARFTDMRDFITHVIFATDKIIAEKPLQVRAFNDAWFETIAWMRKNKAESVKIAMEVTQKDEEITARSFDELMPMFSDDGRWDPKALAVLSKALVELKILTSEPDTSKLYTDAFLAR